MPNCIFSTIVTDSHDPDPFGSGPWTASTMRRLNYHVIEMKKPKGKIMPGWTNELLCDCQRRSTSPFYKDRNSYKALCKKLFIKNELLRL